MAGPRIQRESSTFAYSERTTVQPFPFPMSPFSKPLRITTCIAFVAVAFSSCRESKPSSNSPDPGAVPESGQAAEAPAKAAAIPVTVDATKGMTRSGRPYFVKGAGGSGSLEQLAARGANSTRTWTTQGLAEILDQAESLGLTVSAGIWLEPECSWFSYANPEHCAKQAARVKEEVLRYRDHPALLAWGVGNEVEGDGTNIPFWQQIDRLAKLVKELDPAHPTYTAVAGANEAKVKGLMDHVPHLDFLGVNTYGGVMGLRKHLEKVGWKRPWMLTEWGPRGFWESPKAKSGAPIEQTSSDKAVMIRKAYETVISNDGGCLGSYVFIWGWKFEASATWFGLITHEGETTAAADVLQELWSGKRPANRAPDIQPVQGVPSTALTAGSPFEASVQATDPEGDPLAFHWSVLPEPKSHDGSKAPPMPKPVAGTIANPSGDRVAVKAPAKPGIYRLHVWVKDGKGHAATANMPFEVK